MIAAGQPARLRRSWPQRVLITFNCSLIAVCVLGASLVGYSYYRFGNIPRVSLGGVLKDDAPGQPQNFLLVGSDSRAFVNGREEEQSFGSQTDAGGGQRSDTMILVRIDPKAQTAVTLSFPRDLIVTVAGTGKTDRMNTALQGGPDRLIETIKRDFNIPVNHYVQVDFQGFKSLVDAVGGVKLYLEAPVRDHDIDTGDNVSGLDIQETGCVQLNGDQALSYVRSRHFQQFIDGRWQGGLDADLGRIDRQQSFIRTAVRQALGKGLGNPKKLSALIGVAEDNVTIDDELEPNDILKLAKSFQSLEPGTLAPLKLPVQGADFGGASNNVVKLVEDEAQPILDVFRGVEAQQDLVQPSAVSVRVLNGSGRPGEAASVGQALSQAQFNVADPTTSAKAATTVVRYQPGRRAQAELLASYVEPEPTLKEDPTVKSVDAVLITGSDFSQVLSSPRAPDASPPASEAPAPAAPAADESQPVEPTC